MDSLTIIFILNGVFFISLFLLKNIFISLVLAAISLFIILYFLRQKRIASAHSIFNLPSFEFKDSQYISSTVCLIVFLVLQLLIGFNASLFITFFIFSYVNKLRPRISFIIALVLFVTMALLTALGNYKIAEDIAILTYYFLVIGVVWQIIEIRSIKSSAEINREPNESEIKIIAKKDVFQQRNASYNHIFLKRSILIICILVFFSFIIIISIKPIIKQVKQPIIKKSVIKQQVSTPIVTPILKPITHASLVILNATDTRGLAGSAAAILSKDGWQKEFDISTGNYLGDEILSSNILKYTKNFEDRVPLIERSLNIRVTPVLLKQATQEAELTLILGR